MIDELTEALFGTGIPFAVDGWDVAPEANYGVISMRPPLVLYADDRASDEQERFEVHLYCHDEGSEDAERIMQAMNAIEAAWVMVECRLLQDQGLKHYQWSVSE